MTDDAARRGDADGRLGSLAAVVGWIGAGAVGLGAVLLVVDSVVGLPLGRRVSLGLGLALGGGLGAVLHLFRTDERAATADETMTVASESAPASPEPADLFEGHPDPVVFFVDEGHGPVVRAANDAVEGTFDVPVDQLTGAPLSEALAATGADAAAATDGTLDTVVTCETATGTTAMRLRSVGTGPTGYLLFTPVE
ncbi:hypothetical protein [Haloarcula litorea]|uniref:hypothetical protein n=1 Tax=Haloarcula litorea TaxID=3032579 RepID=UPI0023E79985|nr:hypothetical protein [Halomicroarcula sp. GDY20]